MSRISWLQRGSQYSQVEGDYNTVEKLPVGVYNINFNPMMGWSVSQYAKAFVFDYKVYGLQNEFIQYVLKTFKETTGNMGILLNGVRGSGKTVSAKVLANLLNLPVVIVKDMGELNQAMIEYLSTFNFDCVLFFDEFEKNFSDKDSTILQIMDGVYNIGYRKIFLMTTNSLDVNENLLDRPSRVRYVKQFGNLDLSVVKEFLEDNLEDKSVMNELIEFIDTLKISTIDILKAVVNEVNIHGMEEFKKAKKFFNVSTSTYDYTCIHGYIDKGDMKDLKDKKGDLIKLFLRQSEAYQNPEPQPPVKEIGNPTEEESKAIDEWRKRRYRDFNNFGRTYVKSDTRVKNLKIGDIWNDDEVIIQIDYKKNVIVTEYESDEIYFYHVTNPESRPSLYKDTNVAYGYYGLL